MRAVDLTGRRFGKLTVIERTKNKGVKTAWVCRCDCGAVKEIVTCSLTAGKANSCGCVTRERTIARNLTHGQRHTKLYNTWRGMKDRCCHERNKEYHRYGGRGIRVCEEWMTFEPFRDWALANGYADGLTIDRIDNDKGYEPGNCQWLSRQDNIKKKGK